MKLYVRETQSRDVRDRVRRSDQVATSAVAYPEARAALARRHREGGFSRASLRLAVSALDGDLERVIVVELTRAVVQRAGDLAERHALRGFDAIHLASALELGGLLGDAPRFLAYDAALTAAAVAEGLAKVT